MLLFHKIFEAGTFLVLAKNSERDKSEGTSYIKGQIPYKKSKMLK